MAWAEAEIAAASIWALITTHGVDSSALCHRAPRVDTLLNELRKAASLLPRPSHVENIPRRYFGSFNLCYFSDFLPYDFVK